MPAKPKPEPLCTLSLLVGEERIQAGILHPLEPGLPGIADPTGFTCADVQRVAGIMIAIYGAKAVSKSERIRPPGRELFAMMVEREVKARLAQ